jgi:hypothetical protein
MSDDPRRVEVGFSGGQSIAMRIPDDAFERLRKSVQNGRGWTEVETADGLVALDLSQVVFIRVETSEHRVGFSGL